MRHWIFWRSARQCQHVEREGGLKRLSRLNPCVFTCLMRLSSAKFSPNVCAPAVVGDRHCSGLGIFQQGEMISVNYIFSARACHLINIPFLYGKVQRRHAAFFFAFMSASLSKSNSTGSCLRVAIMCSGVRPFAKSDTVVSSAKVFLLVHIGAMGDKHLGHDTFAALYSKCKALSYFSPLSCHSCQEGS